VNENLSEEAERALAVSLARYEGQSTELGVAPKKFVYQAHWVARRLREQGWDIKLRE
jgi:hypothetical protein